MTIIERPLPNAEWLRAFLAIAECRNLTAAAMSLHKTQSAISVQLRKLEQSLGTALFERSVTGMELTAAGRALLPHADAAVMALLSVQTVFDTPLSGQLRLGIPDDFDDDILGEVLSQFATAHPGVDVIATSGCTSTFPARIRKNNLDIAVCSGPTADGGEILSTEPTVWAVSRSNRFEATKPIALAQLDRGCWWATVASNTLEDAGIPYQVVFTSNSFSSLKAAIGAGIAVGALPLNSLDSTLRVLGPRPDLPQLPDSVRTINVARRADSDLTAAMTTSLKKTLNRRWRVSAN